MSKNCGEVKELCGEKRGATVNIEEQLSRAQKYETRIPPNHLSVVLCPLGGGQRLLLEPLHDPVVAPARGQAAELEGRPPPLELVWFNGHEAGGFNGQA